MSKNAFSRISQNFLSLLCEISSATHKSKHPYKCTMGLHNTPQTNMTQSSIWINVTVLTCYRKASCTAGNGSQVVDSGNTLIDALVWLVVLRVDHVGEEQRAIRQYASPLVWNQTHECTVFLPLDARRRGCVAVYWAVEQGRVTPNSQRVLGLHREPEGTEGVRCWTWWTRDKKRGG